MIVRAWTLGSFQGARDSPGREGKSRTDRFGPKNHLYEAQGQIQIQPATCILSRGRARRQTPVHFNLDEELRNSRLKCSAPSAEEPCAKLLTSFGNLLPIPLCLRLEKFLLPPSLGAATARNRGGGKNNLCPAKFPTASHGLPGDATVLAKVADESNSLRISNSPPTPLPLSQVPTFLDRQTDRKLALSTVVGSQSLANSDLTTSSHMEFSPISCRQCRNLPHSERGRAASALGLPSPW